MHSLLPLLLRLLLLWLLNVPLTFDAAAIIARACTGAKSPAKAASIDQFPTPGQAKTISIITAVPIKSPQITAI